MAVVQSVLEALWRQSWQAAVVAGLVLILRWLFARWIGARWWDLLWIIVLAKLNLPRWYDRVSGHWKTAPAIAPAPTAYSSTFTDTQRISSQSLPPVRMHPI